MNGSEIANSYLKGEVPESNKCNLLRSLFSYCSYCSCSIGSGPGWFTSDPAKRCTNCGWVYCKAHVDEQGICQSCKDAKKASEKGFDASISNVENVLVVGTGMGGLAMALALKTRGVKNVTILERTTELRTSGGPINVQTNAMRALLDVDPDTAIHVLDEGGRLDDFGAFATVDGKELLVANLSTPKESRWGNPEGRSMVRGHLQQVMYDRCVKVGVKVHFGIKVTHVDQTNSQVTVKAEEVGGEEGDSPPAEHTFYADLLVAADGIRSVVRSALFTSAANPAYQGYQMIVSRAAAEEFDQSTVDCWGEIWGNAHRFGFFRCGEGGTAVYYARTCDENLDKDKFQAELKEILIDSVIKGGYNDKIVELAKATDVTKFYCFTIKQVPIMSHHVKGRVVLLGDAANGMPPNLGQGGGMALESASILSQCLLVNDTLKQALENYEVRRIGRCSLISTESKKNGDLFQASNWFTVWLRNTLFAYLGKQANDQSMDVLERPDPFAFLFSYRQFSWRPPFP